MVWRLVFTMLLMLVCIFFDITQGSQDNRDVDDDFFENLC